MEAGGYGQRCITRDLLETRKDTLIPEELKDIYGTGVSIYGGMLLVYTYFHHQEPTIMLTFTH